jgi:hypothetical protein
MTNHQVGKFEAQSLAGLSPEEWQSYLNTAVVLFAGSPASHQIPALSPDLFRSLMNVIRHCAAKLEADLEKREAKGKDTKGHVCHDVRRLAHWATIQSYPIGAFESWRRYGIDPQRL